jgi:hypothetical protein
MKYSEVEITGETTLCSQVRRVRAISCLKIAATA